MNRKTYFKELSKYLNKLPKSEYDDAIGYFEECFDEVGEDEEEALIAELGAPRDVAIEVLENLASDKLEAKEDANKTNDNKIVKGLLITVLLIFAAPIGIPLTIALIIVIIALVVVLGSFIFSGGMISIAAFLSSIKLLIVGIMSFGVSASGCLVIVGFSLVAFAISILILVITILFAKFLMFCMKKIVKFVSSKRRSK